MKTEGGSQKFNEIIDVLSSFSCGPAKFQKIRGFLIAYLMKNFLLKVNCR